MLKSSLCNYSDAYILASGIITVAQVPAPAANPSNNNKEGIIKNCAPFTDFISEINDAQIDNAKNIDVVMPMYKLIELSGNYLKTSGNLQQYQRHEPNVNNASDVADFPVDSALFKFKQKIIGDSSQLKIMQRYYNNWNQVLKEQLTGTNINQSINRNTKPMLRLLS